MSDEINELFDLDEQKDSTDFTSGQPNSTGQWSDFFSFKTMITPIAIKVLFWIGISVFVLFGVVLIFTSFRERYGEYRIMSEQFWSGCAFLFLGPIIVRIYCELLIVFFRINETLTEISGKLK